MPVSQSNFVDKFLETKSTEERLRYLNGLNDEESRLPLSVTEDLFCFTHNPRVQGALLRATRTDKKLEFEDFLTQGFATWDQNVAAIALWEWALRTDCLLWHRTIPLARDPRVAQRVGYTLLDLAWYGAGDELVQCFSRLEGLEGLSPAFLAILFYRAIQWNTPSERLKTVATQIIDELHRNPFPGEKTVPYAVAYLLRYEPETLQSSPFSTNIQGLWPALSRSLGQAQKTKTTQKDLESALKKNKSNQIATLFTEVWPQLWERHKIPVDLIRDSLVAFINGKKTDDFANPSRAWELFAGIPSPQMEEALIAISDDNILGEALAVTGNLLNTRMRLKLMDHLKQRIAASTDPAAFLALIPQRFRIQLNQDTRGGIFPKIFEEQRKVLADESNTVTINSLFDKSPAGQPTAEDGDRRAFMNLAYRSIDPPPANVNHTSYWSALIRAWQNPDPRLLGDLAQLARKTAPVYQICYINTLGRFRNNDEAALKLLDFIRMPEEDTITAVVRALAGIGTQRALHELISFLTRPNVNSNTQMEIIQFLQQADLRQLQKELRSAISDLNAVPTAENPAWDLRESLANLLTVESSPVPGNVPSMSTQGSSERSPSTEVLDEMLQNKIQNYSKLSSEIKRALRTAQFFQLKVEGAKDLHTIDLSPAIDMQYKALELLFRENFEVPCSDVISQGIIGRKLDVIGYARPIPPAMDEFERFMESLDVIKTIPFFSKFKLRKMLRAICQFRPGKRFTLDGLKAFALFFLCFSRKECRYGLANLFPIPSLTDRELAEFCKTLHIFQDFRNRAAHEGFHPDASNDLDKIWLDTAQIIRFAMVIKQNLDEDTGRNKDAISTPTNKSNPAVIVKKVS